MERRVLLAIFLSFLVLYVYQALVVKPVPKPPAAIATSTAAPQGLPAEAPRPAPKAPGPVTVSAPAATALVGDATERDVRVDTRDVIAVFTNRGARLKSWRLKHFLDEKRQPQELVVNLPNEPLPFTLRASDDATTAALTSALYVVSGAPPDQSVPSTP